MKFWMSFLVVLLLSVQPLAASEPAYDTLPPELVRLRDEGRLTVRALWAWNLVPKSTAGMALEFRAMGLDLIEADGELLGQWARQADAGELSLTPEQRGLLDELLVWMNSGLDVEPVQPEAVVSAEAQIEQTAEPATDQAASLATAAPATDVPVADGLATDAPVTDGQIVAEASPQEGSQILDPAVADSASVGGEETGAAVEAESVPASAEPATHQAPVGGEGSAAMYRGGAERTGVTAWAVPEGQPSLVWKCELTTEPCRDPVAFGNMAYIGSVDGHLYAVDLAKGELGWKYDAEDWIDYSPAVFADTVYFGNTMGDKSGDRHLFAVDAATGNEKWRFKSQFYGVNSSPAIVDGTVYFGAGDKHLYALDALSGEKKWSFLGEDSVGTPAIADGTIFFPHGNRLTALELGAEAEKWTFKTQARINVSPVVADGAVYVGAADDFHLYAVDALSGQEKWKFNTGLIHYPPAVRDGLVLVVSFDNLFALDARSGTLKWTVNTQRESLTAPVMAQDTILVGAGRFLLALDPADGREKWRFEAGDKITTPAVLDGTVYFWSEDGFFYAVR
ncbi:MAG: PQQ-binding-like beta-propeller repeat protein [Desulfomicrobium sp.]|nr:PQQ-binding-like beta-propeller repeat protein [Desulfomicrobium sp.]